MATETWLEGTRAAVSITLNGVANNGGAISGTALNGAGYLYARFQLDAAWAAAPSANQSIEMYFVQQTDGTDYEDGSATVTPEVPAWVFSTRAATPLQRITPPLPIPPDAFHVVIVNKSGAAFDAAGNSLAWQPLTPQSA